MLKSNRDPTQRYKVIIEKPTYAGDEMHSRQFIIPYAINNLLSFNDAKKLVNK